MRELKFRAWDKLSRTMLPGAPWEIATVAMQNDDFEVMQFIGIRDRNGREVYEGDILLCGDQGECFPQEYDEAEDEYKDAGRYAVKWCGDDDYPAYDLVDSPCDETNGISQALATGSIEVVGNVFEHPELLKKEKP